MDEEISFFVFFQIFEVETIKNGYPMWCLCGIEGPIRMRATGQP
jgi:hypothetical protein